MTKIFFLALIIFTSLFNLSSQNVEYYNIDSLYHIVDSLSKNDDNVELTLDYVNLILKSDTCNANLFAYKGWYYDKKGDYETAKYFYFRAITVDSLHFNALYALGVLYYNEGVREMDTAINPMTHKRYLEKSLIASNKYSLSKTFFNKAFAVNSDVPELIGILSEIRRKEFKFQKFIENLITH